MYFFLGLSSITSKIDSNMTKRSIFLLLVLIDSFLGPVSIFYEQMATITCLLSSVWLLLLLWRWWLFLNWTSHFSHLYDFPFHALFKIKPLFLSSNAYACLFCHSYIIHSFDVDVLRHKEWCCLCRTSLQRWLSSTAAYRRPPRYWNSTSLINEIETRIALSNELAKVPLDVTLWSRSLRRLAPAARSQMSSDWEAKCFFFFFWLT